MVSAWPLSLSWPSSCGISNILSGKRCQSHRIWPSIKGWHIYSWPAGCSKWFEFHSKESMRLRLFPKWEYPFCKVSFFWWQNIQTVSYNICNSSCHLSNLITSSDNEKVLQSNNPYDSVFEGLHNHRHLLSSLFWNNIDKNLQSKP